MDLHEIETSNNARIILDNDSGYISHFQESNSSVINEINDIQDRMKNIQQVYISEDALLEKPSVSHSYCKDVSINENEIIDASQSTQSTNYSGFQDEVPSSTDKSTIIKVVSPIYYRNKGDLSISDTSMQESSIMNESTDMSLNNSSFNTTASQEVSLDLQLNSFIAKQNTLKEALNSTDILASTPTKKYKNHVNPDMSPELFSEEEDLDELNVSDIRQNLSYAENYIHKFDQVLMRRVQKGINGLLPPPSLKLVTLTVTEMLDRLDKNKHLFLNQETLNSLNSSCSSIYTTDLRNEVALSTNMNNTTDNLNNLAADANNVPTTSKKIRTKSALVNCNINEAQEDIWPDVLSKRHHGLQ